MRTERRFQQLDLALESLLARVANRLTTHPVANPGGLRRDARGLLEQRAARQRLRVEVVELLPIRARAQQRGRALGRHADESGEARTDERDPIAALGELAFVDDV